MHSPASLLEHASRLVGGLGVLVILCGVLVGLTRFVSSEVSAARGVNVTERRRELRHGLGYYLLLGLEFLIAADVMDTLMRPEPRELLVLGAIVAIRTVISVSLHAELSRPHALEGGAP